VLVPLDDRATLSVDALSRAWAAQHKRVRRWLGLEVLEDVLQVNPEVLGEPDELVGRPKGRRAAGCTHNTTSFISWERVMTGWK
jgi:hypothetical protein